MSDNSLMNLGDLAKPATTLIEKVADATGILYEPTRIKRRAKAEAKAEKIQAEAKIELTDIHRRAAQRWIEEETQRQESIENTITKAIPQLNEDADPHAIEDDWIINFFDKCRLVTDDKVQDLWASILARESDTPGSFSQLTVNSLENFGKRDAESFISLCRFVCYVNSEPIPFVQNANHEIYTQTGIDSEALVHLSSLNVIETISALGGSRGVTRPSEPRINAGESITIIYFDEKLEYVNAGKNQDKLGIGSIAFTSFGKELLSICENKKVDGFYEYLKHNWDWSRIMGSKIRVEDDKIIRT